MALLAFDLGATKLATAVMDSNGSILSREIAAVASKHGAEVGGLITGQLMAIIEAAELSGNKIESVGISVPGIYRAKTGTVWAPNISGWDDYPLLKEVENICENIPVTIDSDRACYILGERWNGNARQCNDAIFLAVGTGIGAGILINGRVFRGAHDIAGAIGWMALQRPFLEEYIQCGCFESHASGAGIGKRMQQEIKPNAGITVGDKDKILNTLSSYDVFADYEKNDAVARKVVNEAIAFWGMAAANLVSLFNPEKIIFGGGLFGPAVPFIPAIKKEAARWAQPISIQQVQFEPSALGKDAGVYGAGFLAMQKLSENKN